MAASKQAKTEHTNKEAERSFPKLQVEASTSARGSPLLTAAKKILVSVAPVSDQPKQTPQNHNNQKPPKPKPNPNPKVG